MLVRDLILKHRLLLCAGPGGVGKTTTSAALALAAAQLGRKALVLTIDPAKRLATSLGLETLDDRPRQIALSGPTSIPGGELWAMMLDQKRAFDGLVEKHVQDAALRERIYSNRIYQQLSTVLTGSHEYAAMATLWELDQERRFDLIVLDTPPTQNALGFLDAPDKILSALDSSALQWFLAPYEGKSFGARSLSLLGVGGAFVIKRLASFVGTSFIDDIARFFVEFRTLLDVFRERAEAVRRLLRDDQLSILLVSSPDPNTLVETAAFREQLKAREMPFAGIIFNRAQVTLGKLPSLRSLEALLAQRGELRDVSESARNVAAAAFLETATQLETSAVAERALIDALIARSGAAHTYLEVPPLSSDVHDLRGLAEVVSYLLGPQRH